MKRRTFIKATAGLASLTATIAPVTGASGLRWSPPETAVDHSGGRYSWSVSVDDLDTLEDWIEGSDDRRLVSSHKETDRARIVAKPEDIGVGALQRLFDEGLAGSNWVDRIEIDRAISIPDPIIPGPRSEVWRSLNRRENLGTLAATGSRPRIPTDGLAFDDDMPEVTLETALKATRVDAVDVSGDGVLIAVIDTGINDGEIFADQDGETRISSASKEFLSDDEETGLEAIEDGNLHGTWCASAIAADPDDDEEYRGILPEADLLGLRALDDDGEGRLSAIEHAILYAADEGADVINLSLGSSLWSPALDEALEYAVEEGSIPIAAVGNDRQVTRWVGHPASTDHAIAVGAVTADDPDDAKSAYFSNIGPHSGSGDLSEGESSGREVDLAAPGTEIEVITPRSGRSTRETVMTGTSMSTPIVAGIAGMLSVYEDVDELDDMRDRLQSTARPIPNAAAAEVGSGMVDAEAALEDDEADDDQESEMIDAASDRDRSYRALSTAQGRFLFDVI